MEKRATAVAVRAKSPSMSSAVALKKEPAGVSAAGMSAPAPSPASAPALGASDLAGTAAAASPADYSQWAAAAAMQSYYAGANKTPVAAAAAAANGTQAAAYYAQMAQNPSLYAQMWNPVRAPTRPIERSRENRDSPRHVVRPARRHFADIFSHPSVSLTTASRRRPRPLSHDEQTIASNPFPGANGAFPYPNPYGISYATAITGGKAEAKPGEAAEGKEVAAAVWSAANARGGNAAPQPDERELKRQRRKQSNRESARRSRLRKQAECEELGSRVGGLTEENEKLRGEVKRLMEQCTSLSEDNKRLRGSVEAAGGTIDTPAPTMPDGPTEEEKAAAAAAGAAAAAEAMEAAKKAAALAAGDSDDPDEDGSKDAEEDDSK